MPELLSYIQVAVDNKLVPELFILTGSHQMQLSSAISQSLADRTALLELLSLSLSELQHASIAKSLDEYLYGGLYPVLYSYKLDLTVSARSYIRTYVERDVRQIKNIKDLEVFQKFLKLCAGRIATTINYESLSNEEGVSQTTITNKVFILYVLRLDRRISWFFYGPTVNP